MVTIDRAPLERLDVFPYRHRVADVMRSPLVTLPADKTLEEAARLMARASISSLVIDPEGQAGGPGIVTERDLLRAVAKSGEAALSQPLRTFMSAPLQGVPAESYLFVAIGRMTRLGIRHLIAFNGEGRPIGMVTARALLKQRATQALVLGDEVSEAKNGPQLRNVQQSLPALAGSLLAEGLPPGEIAEVISAVLREISARAASLAAEALGEAPAPWAFLVLGSGGRGESLLSADQDNAIVHAGGEAEDAWFAELGARASDILDEAGIPYCKGGVMASKPAWRHSLAQWQKVIEGWAAKAEGESLLAVDIFYDFRRVLGSLDLAEGLRAQAMQAARRSLLARMMAQELAGINAPLGLFGGFRLKEGRLDLKLHGLFPIVAGARAMALVAGIPATSTVERLSAVTAGGRLSETDLEGLLEAYDLLLGLILRQQIADLGSGRPAGTRVDPAGLGVTERRRLKEALKRAAAMATTTVDAVTDR